MKIAYFLDLFPVFSETFIVREILDLRKNGFEVLVFAQHNTTGREFSEVIHPGAKKLMKGLHYFSSAKNKRLKPQLAVYHIYFLLLSPKRYLKTFRLSMSHSRKMFNLFKRSVLSAMKFKRSKISHIHAHFALDACTLSMLSSMLTGISYSFTVHAHDIFIPELAELVEEKFNRAKFVACISEYNKKFVLKKYSSINSKNIKIIHCGVDVRSHVPSTNGRGNKFTIVSVGRLAEQKGFKYLIEACKIMKEKWHLDFVCIIIGEGKEREDLEQIIRKFDLVDTVHLLGAMEQPDVMKVLESAYVFVLPCVVEKTGSMDGIPVALMEAMAMEIPVVSTKVSGIPELIKDGGGILVEPEDSNRLALSIMKVLSFREEEREKMGRKGRSIIEEEYSLSKEVWKLGELFRN